MDKTFLGLDCSSLEKGIESQGITKVEILNNSGNIVGTAGNDTGKTLTVTNPDGTNAMATYILSLVSGYVQRGYEASESIVDPAVEIGDGVTVGGIYSVIARQSINYDSLCSSDISAPDADEIEDEYPYETYQQRVERNVAKTYSEIKKTENSISLIVDSNTGNVTAAKIIASINNDTSGIVISADKVDITGFVTFSDLSTSGRTTINGANLITGTVIADDIKGSSVSLLSDSGGSAGTISLTDASSVSGKKIIMESKAIELSSDSGDIFLRTHIGSSMPTVSAIQIHNDSYMVSCTGNFTPQSTEQYSLGQSGLKWTQVWANTGTIQTSDRNKKKNIGYDISDMDGFFDLLKPVSYKFINGTSNRTHYGLIAQDVEESLGEIGKTTEEFAGVCKDENELGEYDYALRYDEFICLCIEQIQKLKARVSALEDNA